MIRLASVCSGIGGAELAFEGLAAPVFVSEVDPFARAVLQQRFPRIPLRGDFTEIGDAAADVLVGGTPCQSFSVAGLRGGMADARGNLALEYIRLAERLRARWVLWENVPGVLSSSGGRDFGAFLGGLAELGYQCCWRVLDAQYFGLAQRRKRVFVVGCLGDWRRAAAVLFEPASLRGDPAPRREARERTAGTLAASLGGSDENDAADSRLIAYGGNRQSGPLEVATAVNAHGGPHGRQDFETETFVIHALKAEGFDASEDGTGRGVPLVAFDARQSDVITYGDRAGPLDTDGYSQAVAFHENQRAELTTSDTAGALKSGGGKPGQGYPAIATWQQNSMGGRGTLGYDADTQALRPIKPQADHQMLQLGSTVRRLTPTECERLQGYPDGWTAVEYRGRPAADGPRYRALGNAFAVPVVRWIARRLVREADIDQPPGA